MNTRSSGGAPGRRRCAYPDRGVERLLLHRRAASSLSSPRGCRIEGSGFPHTDETQTKSHIGDERNIE